MGMCVFSHSEHNFSDGNSITLELEKFFHSMQRLGIFCIRCKMKHVEQFLFGVFGGNGILSQITPNNYFSITEY
jgi:hypothetical protein